MVQPDVPPAIVPVDVEENEVPADSKFSLCVENMAEHAKKRNATFWGFYKTIEGDDKGTIMVCSICKPEIGPNDAGKIMKSSKKIKGILRYKPASGSSGLRKHISYAHESVSANFPQHRYWTVGV